MIHFSSLLLKAFVVENRDYLVGACVRKIKQPSRKDLLFTFWSGGVQKKFYACLNPDFFHCCFISDDRLEGEDMASPQNSPMFCMLLRKYINNSKIKDINVPEGERILELFFDYYDELGDLQKLCLAFEFMGRYSNVILYDYSSKVIIGCLHNVGSEKSRYREMYGGITYDYPQMHTKFLIEDYDSFINAVRGIEDIDELCFVLGDEFSNITHNLAKNVVDKLQIKEINDDNLQKMYKLLNKICNLENIEPAIKNDYSEFSLIKPDGFQQYSSVNSMINEYFGFHQNSLKVENLRNKYLKIIDSKLKKIEKQKKIELSKIAKSDNDYKLKGDILMTNPYIAVQNKILVENPFDLNSDKIEIELDIQQSIIENANRYYKLYKKSKTAKQYAENEIQKLEEEKSYYEDERFFVEIAEKPSDFNGILENEKVFQQKNIQNKQNNKKQKINITKVDIEGFEVYVGKNSIQNDYILSKLSSGEDLWFHPLNVHGSHVLLKIKDKNPNDKVLLECAQLAKKYSVLKNDSKASIIYTKRKYLKKANNKLAFVTYKNEKEIVC